jgi:hypothetical protein
MSAAKRSMLGAAILLIAVTSPATAAELTLPADGWASWQVPAVDGAPAWCCTRKPCSLDGNRSSYGMQDGDSATDAVNVYARVSGGKVDSLQVYAASCPVETKTPMHDLGDVAPDDSARWLIARVRQDDGDAVTHRTIGEGALTALALHRGDVAGNALAGFARQDARAETRKQALFWLGIVRGNEATSERVINEALRKDPDGDVREHAVFALSRLPGARATHALIAIAEDQSIPREQRKRAVFWLAQSESDSAQAYLDRVLARSSTR